jgi:myo-inositol-1(or 4)-monophosphatase
VEIERILVAGLAQIDAPAGVTSEEGALCSGEAVWAIDPIDGTQNYLTGDPHWAIVLGRLNCGQADFGISYFPALDLFIGGGPSFGLDIKGQFERRSESLPRRAMVPRFFRAAYCNESRWDLRSRRCTSWHFAAVALGLAEVCLIGPNWQPWDVVGGCALLGGAKLAVRHVDGDDLDLADPFRRPILGGTPSLMDSFAADLLG